VCSETLKSVGFGRNFWTCLYCPANGSHALTPGKPTHYSSAAYSAFLTRCKGIWGEKSKRLPTCDDAQELLGVGR
jgi:hypothetical protein